MTAPSRIRYCSCRRVFTTNGGWWRHSDNHVDDHVTHEEVTFAEWAKAQDAAGFPTAQIGHSGIRALSEAEKAVLAAAVNPPPACMCDPDGCAYADGDCPVCRLLDGTGELCPRDPAASPPPDTPAEVRLSLLGLIRPDEGNGWTPTPLGLRVASEQGIR